MGFWRKMGQAIVTKAQEELNDDPQQQASKPQTPQHQSNAPGGPPSFPSAQPYGGSSYDHLSSQFNNLNIGPASGQSTPAYAYNNNNSSYGASCSILLVGRAYYAGSARPPVRRCITTGNTASSPPAQSLPSVLTPGNSAGLQYGGQPSQNADYLLPLKNPLPRPPQFSNIPIPEPWDPYQRYYGGNTPQGDNLMAPMGPPGGSAPAGYPYPYSGPQSAASSPGPAPAMPSPGPPGFGRASSQPPPASSQTALGDGTNQCSGVTKKGIRCTRKVKSPPALGWINPEDEIPRYCHQHSKELLGVSGFYSPKGWVDFD
ncbi:hypothetical protein FRB90_005238, partial [Tulasnella sp. 427]